jgi:vacuolar-type H+-ATPase subunit E/Vma4
LAHCDGAPDLQVEEAADADAGLLGETLDGRLVVDNRLSALLARRRAELSVAVARRLEDG